jgi:hypothetical protein
MNPYIEFAQWAIAGWKRWYQGNGTKLWGSISATFGMVQAILAGIAASPDFQLLVTPRQFQMLSLVNIALGAMVLKRGFTNSRAPPATP